MGNLMNRSSAARSESTKIKWKKKTRKRMSEMRTSADGDKFLVQDVNEQKDSVENAYNKQEEWTQRMDQQQQLSNSNVDPPGAPRTYSSNYPMSQTDLMSQSWSASHDMNNPFYPNTSLPMTTATSAMKYPPTHYIHSSAFANQTQPMTVEERSSKKVQFALPIQQQIPSNNPLTSAQSWHEPSLTNNNDASILSTKQESQLSKPALHQSLATIKNNTASVPAFIQKPIYVGIDHQATLAERGQTKASRHHHKNGDKTNSTTNGHHRPRPHSHQQNKHQEVNDFSISKQTMPSNKPLESFQGNTSNAHRTLVTTSTSTFTPNKQMQHIEPSLIHDNQIKRARGNRQSQAPHIEQQSFIENDTKIIANRVNPLQAKQQRPIIHRNNSPVRTETIRRIEIKQPGASVINVPLSQTQQRPKQSQMITPTNITRTRI